MIINLRGTSGSGKSTLVRQVMASYLGGVDKIRCEGRRQPLAYKLLPKGGRELFIPGHYETACGGCDTIPSMDRIYQLVRDADEAGHDVLYEGLLISAEVRRCRELHEDGRDLVVIGLDVPIETCLASVNHRRLQRNPQARPVNPRNTEAKHRQTQRSLERLQEAGVETHYVGREEAAEMLQRLLELPR